MKIGMGTGRNCVPLIPGRAYISIIISKCSRFETHPYGKEI
jgi:hypothetical protein